MRYRIYDLSVRAMLNYSKPDGLFYKTVIDKNALRSCLKHSAHEQDDNALFYQIMCVLHGDDFKCDSDELITELSDVIFYADFSRVFDRDASHPYYAQLQEKAAALFTNRGVEIDFGNGIADVVLLQKWLLAVPDTKLADWKAANFYNDNRLDVFDLCLMKRKLIYG